MQAPPVAVPVAEVSPGLFVQSCGETRAADYLDGSSVIACNADGTLNYAASAAPQGSTVFLRMTGLGPVHPPIADGEPAGADPPAALLLPQVTIDGLPAEVVSVTLAPGEVGVYDVAVVVPPGSRTASRIPVAVTVEGVTSNLAVLAVGAPAAAEPLPCMGPSAPLIRTCRP